MDVDMQPQLSVEWYPARVLLHKPGLAQPVTSRGAVTGPERAFDVIRELLLSNDEQ